MYEKVGARLLVTVSIALGIAGCGSQRAGDATTKRLDGGVLLDLAGPVSDALTTDSIVDGDVPQLGTSCACPVDAGSADTVLRTSIPDEHWDAAAVTYPRDGKGQADGLLASSDAAIATADALSFLSDVPSVASDARAIAPDEPVLAPDAPFARKADAFGEPPDAACDCPADAGASETIPDVVSAPDVARDVLANDDQAALADLGDANLQPDATDAGVDIGSTCDPTGCDDGNPCTLDFRDVSCACVHSPAPEGSSCDDGSACTGPDQCTAGVCKGQPRSGSPTILGTVRSYGSGPALDTVVGLPSQDRAVFLTNDLLTLVKIDGDRMEVLDRLQWGSRVQSSPVSPSIWVFRPGTFIVPISSTRVAVIGTDWSIDIFDISQDRLQISCRYGFGSGSQDLVAAAVPQGNNIWTCMGNWMVRYELDDARKSITKDEGFGLPGSHSCYGLALSSDGQSLLAATSAGLDIIDITSNDGKGILTKTVLPGEFLLDVVSNGQTLGVYQLDGYTSGIGKVLALNATDYSPVATFDSVGSIYSVGFTVLADGLLLEQWNEEGCRTVNASLYAQGGSATTPSTSLVPLAACRAHFGLPPVVMASAGHLADLPPAHQIVRVDANAGALTPLRGREQGSYARVLPVGPSLVEVHGPTSMHLIDISQPTLPVVRDGGLLSPMNADWLRIRVSSKGEAAMLTVPDDDLTFAGPRLSLTWESEGKLPSVAGSIATDDPKAQWAAAGQYLYEVWPTGSSDFRLRRLPVSTLTRDEGQAPKPDVDQTVTSAAPETLDTRKAEVVAADATSRDVVVAEQRTGTVGGTTKTASVLSWYVPDGTGYRPSFTRAPDDGLVRDLAVQGDLAVLVFSDRAVLVDKTGATVATYTHPAGSLQRWLSTEGGRTYLAASFKDANQHIYHGVLVLNASDLSVVTQYGLPEPVLSTATVGSYQVFGMASTFAVASPMCSSP